MSHVTLKEADTADQQITDLNALGRAVQRCSGVLKHGQNTFRTWATDHGRLQGDYPVPEGYTEQDIKGGVCEHAISVGDASHGTTAYEIGVVPSKKFPGTFSLMYDFWGGHLHEHFGNELEDLHQYYQLEVAKAQAQAMGDIYSERVLEDGSIVAEVDTTVRLGV